MGIGAVAAALVVAALVVAALLAPAPGAKERVEATLVADVDPNADAGATTRVVWRVAAGAKAFGARGVFVRLDSPYEGGSPTFGFASSGSHAGRYLARVGVPAGGIGGIRIGLRGWSTQSGRADVYFRIRNNPLDDGLGKLRRPLRAPALGADGSCPVTALRPIDLADPAVRRALGPGPAYPLFDGTLEARWDGRSRWGGRKVGWRVDTSYDWVVLARGRRLDGSQEVRFGGGDHPARELRIGAGGHPSFTSILAPGCYAYQIDGNTFSYTIVFRAVRV